MNKKKIMDNIQKKYGKIAEEGTSCCSSCSCGSQRSVSIGYSIDELNDIPVSSVLGLGCGNPTALAEMRKGETVLDLGCGAGIDVFLAAKKVGKEGKVIGIDMTPEMIIKSKENAAKHGYNNVKFMLGEIEKLLIDNEQVDVVISNCVINLSVNKQQTFNEVYRVLKHGGRMIISDIVTKGKLPKSIKENTEAWSDCISGALEKEEYLGLITKAGFSKVKVIAENTFPVDGVQYKLKCEVISIKIIAIKE